jgi:glycerophosphoryl diester phosphodiesterase
MKALLSFDPPVIAHRGASAYAPENTLSAFTKAVALGVKWVEFDVMAAACGEPIVFHDDELQRTTRQQGRVMNFTYHYLQTLDAGAWFDPRFSGERIPRLNDLLVFLAESKMNVNIEIKAPPASEDALIKRVLQEVSPYWNTGQTFLFSSFSLTALRRLREQAPTCLLGLLLDEWRTDWNSIATDLDCITINTNADNMTAARVHEIKMTNRAVLCYTVNDPMQAAKLFEWGVDAVFSDIPDRIL